LRVEEESSPHVSAVRQPSLFHARIAVVAIVAAILARTPAIPGAPHTIAIAYADARAAIVGRAECASLRVQRQDGLRDLNIVLERTDDEPCDLIVATNVLVYYDAFEQALALTNVAKMLRPGGFLLTNYAVSPLPPMEPEASLVTPVFWDRQDNGDALFWYQRRRFAGLTERTEFTEQAFNTETRRHGILEAGEKPAQAPRRNRQTLGD
jgi:SAM-dependent methyltransferase